VVAGEEQDMKDGGPAFPVPAELCQDLTVQEQRGMTLHDWYAGQALIGILARPAVNYRTADELAREAHALARSMLKERSKT
jgi:uncharacterized protein YodC (DUF2158 family)